MDVAMPGLKCSIAADNMSAILNMSQPQDGVNYAAEDIVAFLRTNGVVEGFLYPEIEKILNEGIYNKDVVVARGTTPIDGVNGYYDFYFDMGQSKKPLIRSDGSVDYQSMNIIHCVEVGDVLCVYHSAVPGRHGVDVKGRELRCKPGKELAPIKGDGFSVDEDGITYRAAVEGRVEYDNLKLYIRDIYEIRGDLDLLTGKVDFRGDVVIHGSVRAGTYIRASKSITVEGNVEAAVLIAEGDIVLKKGMQGGSKAKIISGGNIYAYFLEYTDVSAKGSIEANIILNCKISAGKSINVKGKKGLLVGGTYYAVNMLGATNIGNPAQVRTTCAVGLADDITARNHLLMTKLENSKNGIMDAKKNIIKLSDVRIATEPEEVRKAKINQLERRIKRDERMIEHLEKEIEEIRQTMEYSRGAVVNAEGTIYGGVVVRIDDRETVLEKSYNHVQFKRPSNREDIEMMNLS